MSSLSWFPIYDRLSIFFSTTWRWSYSLKWNLKLFLIQQLLSRSLIVAVGYFLVATFNFFTCLISSSNLVTRLARKPLPENVSFQYFTLFPTQCLGLWLEARLEVTVLVQLYAFCVQRKWCYSHANNNPIPGGGRATLGIFGWGCAAGTLEPLAYTRAWFS